jgi:hypothetical protein
LLPDGSVVTAGSLDEPPKGTRFFRHITLSSNRPAKEHEKTEFEFNGKKFLPPANRTSLSTFFVTNLFDRSYPHRCTFSSTPFGRTHTRNSVSAGRAGFGAGFGAAALGGDRRFPSASTELAGNNSANDVNATKVRERSTMKHECHMRVFLSSREKPYRFIW